MMQHVLVTGANGFIGSHLADRLIAKGYSVRCLVRKTSRLKWFNLQQVELVYGDLSDPESLNRAVEGVDTVFHLGGKTKAATREDFFQANAVGTRNLLQAVLKKSKNLNRFVYVSTQAAAGPSLDGNPVRETDPTRPVTPYGESKLAGEKAVLEMSSEIPVTIVRPPTVFGPRDMDLFKLFQTVSRGIRPILGWKERCLSVIYIEDLVSGLMLAAESQQALSRVFFINTEDSIPLQEFITVIAETLGKKTIPVFIPGLLFVVLICTNDLLCRMIGKTTILNRSKIPEFLSRYWISDSSRIRQDLGYAPKYGLTEGIRITADWYRSEGWL